MKITEAEPAAPGTYYGELSPGQQWFWDGTGLPGDVWILNPSYDPSQVPETPEVSPAKTSSQLAYDWIELYLTPVTGP